MISLKNIVFYQIKSTKVISSYVLPKDRIRLIVILIITLTVHVLLYQGFSSAKSKEQVETVNENYEVLGYDNSVEKPTILPNEKIMNKKSVLETDKWKIVIELFADEAPLTVSNHVNLAEAGFYNGLTFHRREEGFVIQGGDPIGNGTGGPGYTFEDEAVQRPYTKGIVAMANRGPDTNGSQFFIMLADNPLPPLYTIFGVVVEGLDVVDQIQIGDKINSVTITD